MSFLIPAQHLRPASVFLLGCALMSRTRWSNYSHVAARPCGYRGAVDMAVRFFRRPLIILITVPLAFVGAIGGVMLANAPFDFFAILGLLSLGGVITNDGIILIARIETVRAAGGR